MLRLPIPGYITVKPKSKTNSLSKKMKINTTDYLFRTDRKKKTALILTKTAKEITQPTGQNLLNFIHT